MPRKKDPEVFAKWSACTAKKIAKSGNTYRAEISFHGRHFDTVSTERSEGALRSLCLAYMKDISPSKSALDARFRMFTSRLKERYGIEPNDVDPRDDIELGIALAMADHDWSMVHGIDDYLREIGEDRELQRIDKAGW